MVLSPVIMINLIPLILSIHGLQYDTNTVDLLLETLAVESDFGRHAEQMSGGPALGVFQMEPATQVDIGNNFIRFRPELHWLSGPEYSDLVNLYNAVLWCRVHYMRVEAAIPVTRFGRAKYWKKYYNTELGRGTVDDYMKKANLYLGEE